MNTIQSQSVIQLEERNNYGRFVYYVTGSHAAAVAVLTRKKTVDSSDVRALEALGFVVRVSGRPEMPASEAMR